MFLSFFIPLLIYVYIRNDILYSNNIPCDFSYDFLDFYKLCPQQQSFTSILFSISTSIITIFLAFIGFVGVTPKTNSANQLSIQENHDNSTPKAEDSSYKVVVQKEGIDKKENYIISVKKNELSEQEKDSPKMAMTQKPSEKLVEKMSIVNLMPEITRENGVSVFDTFSMHFNKEYLRLAVYTLNPVMQQRIQELQQNEGTTEHIELPTSALIQMNYEQAAEIMMGLGIIIQNQEKADALDRANLEKHIENVESFLKYLKEEEHGRAGRK